ncbi:hypothetical protein [Lacihabitans soyangensis]|uniref:Uncharacterized protein n=1 Tax=Lacihabitans soyangensis TaxID=869394 RepID=A0AAE3KUL2_9BACT|nr:hypothetical protein [Lacihabitans soyangensis]MCP9765158.1 hypothetical protein [Lacihabitans soyangensis]
MMTLEDCDCGLRQAQADSSGLTTLEKMYYMARPEPVDLVEGDDGVFREKKIEGKNENERRGFIGRMFWASDRFDSYEKEFDFYFGKVIFKADIF